MNITNLYHDIAMEISTVADVAKAKGFQQQSIDFYQQAYQMEKEVVVLTEHLHQTHPISYFIPLRTAASLAWQAGLYEESILLLETGLAKNPPAWLIAELKEVEQLVQNSLTTTPDAVKISGQIMQADFEKNKITIRNAQQEKIAIQVAANELSTILLNYLAKVVEIEALKNGEGVFTLKNIRAAA